MPECPIDWSKGVVWIRNEVIDAITKDATACTVYMVAACQLPPDTWIDFPIEYSADLKSDIARRAGLKPSEVDAAVRWLVGLGFAREVIL